MKNKIFFKKKKNISKFFIFFIIFIFIFIFIYQLNSNNYFDIPKYSGNFYIIPEDREGTNIINLDKKSLDMHNSNNDFIYNIDENSLNYSIQIFSSDDLILTNNYLKHFLLMNNNLLIDDFFIIFFKNDLRNEYILLYKNFNDKESALNYCNNYLKLLNNCLIANVKNIN